MPESTLTARVHIPKEWLSGAVCPVCGETHLIINQLLNQADCMICTRCASSFEIAQDGDHIRLVDGPSTLPKQVLGTWIKPATLHSLVQKALETAVSETPLKVQEIDIDSLRNRAVQLQLLGNPPDKIEATLTKLPGVDPNDLKTVMDEIYNEGVRKQQKTLRTAIMLTSLLIIFICSLVFMFTPASSVLANALVRTGILKAAPTPEQSLAAAPTQSAQDQKYLDKSRLPAPMQTLIPAGANILEPPDVIVREEARTGKITACPGSAGEAVRVFGGKLDVWSRANFGWTLISTDPQTIHVPEGMYAGYLVFIEKPEFLNVNGPATIENVNFLSISCE